MIGIYNSDESNDFVAQTHGLLMTSNWLFFRNRLSECRGRDFLSLSDATVLCVKLESTEHRINTTLNSQKRPFMAEIFHPGRARRAAQQSPSTSFPANPSLPDPLQEVIQA